MSTIKTALRDKIIAVFHEMDFVTREVFDVQAKVLARTREKLERLEKKIQDLESGKQ